MNKILHIMVGLPKSGKSTFAAQIGAPIVSHDALSMALTGRAWRDESSMTVWAIAHTMVSALFLAGHDEVVLDACNVTAGRRKKFESINWACVFHVINTPKNECIARAKQESQENLIPVIERMAAHWDPPGMGEDC